MGRSHVHAAWEVENRGDFLIPATPHHLFSSLNHLPPNSVPLEAGSQARPKLGAGRERLGSPRLRVTSGVSILMFHFPRSLVRRAHGTRTMGRR